MRCTAGLTVDSMLDSSHLERRKYIECFHRKFVLVCQVVQPDHENQRKNGVTSQRLTT